MARKRWKRVRDQDENLEMYMWLPRRLVLRKIRRKWLRRLLRPRRAND
jgi:hypothetical protein